MADDASSARSALAYLAQLQPGLKGAAIFGPSGEVESCVGSSATWTDRGGELLAALDAAIEGSVGEAHIATQSGEVFICSLNGRRMVAVAPRFVLASLLSFDMRTALRDMKDAD